MKPRYYLEFDDIRGTNMPRFATFRLRGTWARRLRKGSVVFLADSKEHTIFGRAKVLEKHFGKASDILRQHAHESHLEIGGPLLSGAADRRYESMLKRYGPHRFGHDSIISVIFLRRTA